MDPLLSAALASSVISFLSKYLYQIGESAAEKVGENLPDYALSIWKIVSSKIKLKNADDKRIQEFKKSPQDKEIQSEIASDVEECLRNDDNFARELLEYIDVLKPYSSYLSNSGDGSLANHGSVSSGKGGLSIKGNVVGDINLNTKK